MYHDNVTVIKRCSPARINEARNRRKRWEFNVQPWQGGASRILYGQMASGEIRRFPYSTLDVTHQCHDVVSRENGDQTFGTAEVMTSLLREME